MRKKVSSHPSDGAYGEFSLKPRMTRTGFLVSDDTYVVIRGQNKIMLENATFNALLDEFSKL